MNGMEKIDSEVVYGDAHIPAKVELSLNATPEEAVKGALSNPLLEISYKGATGALIHVEGGPDMTLDEVNKIGEIVTENLDSDANVIWGARVSESMKGKIAVMTIITGVNSPWILGKADRKTRVLEARRISDELGIDYFTD